LDLTKKSATNDRPRGQQERRKWYFEQKRKTVSKCSKRNVIKMQKSAGTGSANK